MRRADVPDDDGGILLDARVPHVGRHQLTEVGGVRGEDGPVRAQPLGPGHDGDVGEGHPLADALHHVPDVQQDGLGGDSTDLTNKLPMN